MAEQKQKEQTQALPWLKSWGCRPLCGKRLRQPRYGGGRIGLPRPKA